MYFPFLYSAGCLSGNYQIEAKVDDFSCFVREKNSLIFGGCFKLECGKILYFMFAYVFLQSYI